MEKKKRKIAFHYLTLRKGDIEVHEALNLTLALISSLEKKAKTINIKSPKFGLLDTVTSNSDNTKHKIIFKSASHSFRPPLLDRGTLDERDSPKTMEEGETQRTHLMTKAINGDVIVIIEKHQNGMSMLQIKDYLNKFASLVPDQDQFRFDFETIAKDNFLEEINKLERVISADVYVDKKILGGPALNLSDNYREAKHEIIVSVKAKNKNNISEFAQDVFEKFNGGGSQIERLRVVGKNQDNNTVKINTDFIERQEFVDVDSNKVTGEVDSKDMMHQIDVIMHNFT